MSVHPLETYLKELSEIRSTGGAVPEESCYGALENLLNEVGKKLKPKVRCVRQVADTGAGHPDFGLYTADQFQRSRDSQPITGILPERGVIEVKGLKDDTWLTAEGDQVTRYWGHYNQVLVTNYRDFLLIGRDESGNPARLESFRLAESERAFWTAAAQPRKTANEQGDRFVEYLRRVMLHQADVTDPQVLAWYLASYAREAKGRVDAIKQLPGLTALRKAIEESLGLKFEGEEGEDFFRATLVQTLFYGIFSSWVLWAREQPTTSRARFNWHEAAWNLHVPMIATLFEQIATPQKLKPLGVDEVLDWTGLVLNRVEPPEFFRKFEEEHAVIYFYEPFLKAYDPDLRKKYGVWNTPQEIVKYQVARVDTVLREELDVEDGLADPNVYVLDPCCGTGAYIVEVLRKIHKTLHKKGANALTAQRLKKAALDRIFGFEILPAPFVVAHLQIGLTLRNLGASLSQSERARVYLTNALTGWEPPKEPKDQIPIPFPELEEEREAADEVKRDVPILVILGNPPYNAFAGTSPEEEGGLVEPYKEGLTRPVSEDGWGIKKFNLDDLYVRFFRIAERRIVKTGRGIVCYISNFSYLGDPSFVVMRHRFLQEFDKLWFDCMNGDSRETGKLTPCGKPDPSVFSTEHNREGIRVGTAICLMVRIGGRSQKPLVGFRHFWGVNKRAELLHSLNAKNLNSNYKTAKPQKTNRFSFRPAKVTAAYTSWPLAPELSAVPPYNGPVERRGNSLIVFPDEAASLQQVRSYLDPALSDDEVNAIAPRLMKSSGEYNAHKARSLLKGKVQFDETSIVRYPFKPFDVRLAYLDPDIAPLFSRPSPDLLRQRAACHNAFFVTRDTADKSPEGPPFLFASLVCDYDCISGHARHFPLRITQQPDAQRRDPQDIFQRPRHHPLVTANLSAPARQYMASLGIRNPDKGLETAELIWMQALAIGYSPAYLSENADGIRQDWPRIPLPNSKEALLASAELGEQIAALLDTEKRLPGVTMGNIRPELTVIGVVSRVGGGSLDPSKGDLDLTAGWGHAGKGGATMPGKGKIVERAYSPDELRAIEEGARAIGLTREDALKNLGRDTRDIYLNDVAYWKNIPANVYDYYIGGYQVIKKWLSYREKKVLGRSMKTEEVYYVTEMARRLAAIVLLQPALDENYPTVKSNTYPWPSP
jgi:hypothetical protein